MELRISKRKAQGQDTKKKLYLNALELFRKKGYDSVTVDEICKKSNVSKGAFYTHFSSKHDIIIAQSQRTDRFLHELFNQIPKDMPSADKLLEFVKVQSEHIIDKGMDLERIIYSAELGDKNRPGYIGDENRPVYTCVKAIIREGQERGEFRSDIALDDLVHTMVVCTRGAIYDWMLTNGRQDLTKTCVMMTKLILSGIKA